MQEIIGYENNEGKVKYTKDGIEYNLEKPDVIIAGGGVIGGQYSYDNNDINAEPGSPVINAVDIAWNAHLPISGATIDTTTDLLKHLDAKQSSIPILDNYSIENSDSLPDKYIGIRSERDLISNDTNYLSILFSAIRSLQAEVAKLRNSFKYGINSYNDTNTALGNVITEYSEDQDEEPLWAVDEEDLSEILEFNFTLDSNHSLKPSSNVTINNDNLEINSNGAVFESTDQFKSVVDPKIFLYLTTENLNIKFVLKKKDSDETLIINLADINTTNINSNKFDIMFLLSRQVEINVSGNISLVGNNYAYISIGEYLKGEKFAEGYYDMSFNKFKKQESLLDDIYEITEVQFGENKIWKFNAYYKYQDFTRSVIPSAPSDNDYKYDVAHITIRSVKTFDILNSIKDKLQENELIFVNSTNKLYIKSNGNLINIGASSSGGNDPVNPDDSGNNDNNMTNAEILKALEEQGIISIQFINENFDETQLDEKYSQANIKSYSLNSIGSIQFINEETGKKFNITVDSHGNLISDEANTETIESKLTQNIQYLITNDNNIGTGIIIDDETNPVSVSIDNHSDRGFFALYNLALNGKTNNAQSTDAKLNADRIKIGAVYAPLDTDKVHGCSHGYIELENLSDKDFPLDGVYLHYGKQKADENDNNNSYSKIYHLPLKGVLKAYSTFLIRCKQYAEPSDVNTFIKVNTYDMEWIVREDDYTYTDKDGNVKSEKGQLLDLTQSADDNDNKIKYAYGFLLNYTKFKYYNNNAEDLRKTKILQNYLQNITADDIFVTANKNYDKTTTDDTFKKYAHFIRRDFIDAICISNRFGSWFNDHNAAPNDYLPEKLSYNQKSNSIYKNVFSLDPAKQAFNALAVPDSSRVRWHKKGTDLMSLSLDKEFISFPKSQLIKPISDYTPKASFENKTVCTDKTQLDITKPNIVTCSYGMNIYTTRCFNWISAGLFNEFVWLYDENNGEFRKFESYKNGDAGKTPAISYPHRKEFGNDAINVIYKRITNRFPASNIQYTSHKCILEFNVGDNPVTYKYIVAREDNLNKNIPSSEYRSDEMEFTIYPYRYQPKIYQTSDQQGFHWIEYQVWTAAANKIRQKIDYDLEHENIIPIVINTGDMTQNGTRLNEWLDYYNGGYEIFKKYCQNNIVGNNDLCDVDENILGIGDDPGKSNGYYFHIFNCVDVDEGNLPIVDAWGSREAKVIPSLYYLDIDYKKNNDDTYDLTKPTKRMLMINSEITKTTCQKWYKLVKNNGVVVNLYTGFTIAKDANKSSWSYEAEELHFRTIYNMICKMTENNDTKYIAVCHEMPFTVTTKNSLTEVEVGNSDPGKYRSISNEDKLVGCHMNQISPDDEAPGIYWFSRLLEYKNIGICIGGHKHTYAATYPLCENYYWYSESGYGESDNEPKYVWSFLKPIPMAVETSNSINKYSLEWELIKEQQTVNGETTTINKNRVKWIYDSEICKELEIWNNAKTTEYYFEFWNNNNKEVKYGEGIAKVIETDENYTTIKVIKLTEINENTLTDFNAEDFVGQQFNITLSTDTNNPIQLHTLANELINIWVTVKVNNNVAVINTFNLNYTNNKKYINNRNLSKFPICFTDPLNNKKRPGYNGDYSDADKDKILINTVNYAKGDGLSNTYIYLPVQYALNEKAANTNNYTEKDENDQTVSYSYINEYGDLIKNSDNHPVRYFMMQATGYKLKSNKELPTAYQRYSEIIPKTNVDTYDVDKPAADQQRPMYGEIYFTTEENQEQTKEYINLSIIRIDNILTSDFKFDQLTYGKDAMQLQFVKTLPTNNRSDSRSYGEWIDYGMASDTQIDFELDENNQPKNNEITPLFKDLF